MTPWSGSISQHPSADDVPDVPRGLGFLPASRPSDRTTLNYQVLICAELCHHSSPRCGCSTHARRSQGTYSHPGDGKKKRVLVQGELHFPFLTAEKACLGPPRINKTRSPSSRGHDLLHQAFPSHAAGIAQRRPRSAAISREQGPAEPRLARGWAPPAKSHPGVSAKSLRAPELEMHHAVNPPALGKQTTVEEGEEEATGDGKHPWAAGSPNPSLTRCRQELKEADEPSRLLPLPNSSA